MTPEQRQLRALCAAYARLKTTRPERARAILREIDYLKQGQVVSPAWG